VRVLVTAATGQVGSRVVAALDGRDVCAVSHAELDIADRDQVEQLVGAFVPDAIVNCAALTDVDGCERDPDRAFATNALALRHLAVAADRVGAHVVHISTDYVFDGHAERPYHEWDAVAPLSVYGWSKLGGERGLVAHPRLWTIVRTSWVFGRRGTDIVSWALDAHARGELTGVIADQCSIPTYAPDLAEMLVRFAVERRLGLFHVTSGDEPASRHALVVAALRERGLDASGVAPLATADLPRPATRPLYSALDNRALRLAGLAPLRPWREALAEYLHDEPLSPRHETGAGDE